MAVYVVPNRRRNYWGNVSLNLGNGLLGNVINGMFERDARAREAGRSKRLYEAVADEMTPQAGLPQPEAPRPEYGEEMRSFANRATRGGGLYDSYVNPTDNGGWSGLWDSTPGLGKDKVPGREDFLRGLARYGATEQQAKTLTDLYMNQFETADKLGYQDSVASRLGGLDYDVRGNAPEAARSAAVAGAYGVNMGPIYDRTAPGFTFSGADLGDRYGVFSQDNLTGNYRFTSHNKGTDPTHTADNISREKVANINKSATLGAAGIRANADLTPKTSVVYDKDGKAYYVDNRGGAPRGIGVQGPVKGQGAAKPLSPSVYNFIDKKIAEIAQTVATQDEYNNKINMLISSNPQAQEYIMQSAGSPRYMWNNGAVSKTYGNSYAAGYGGSTAPAANPSQEIAEYRRLFPQVTQGLTDEQVAERIKMLNSK